MSALDSSLVNLVNQADDGDPLAVLALRDRAEEEGRPLCQPLVPGDWVYVWTASHAFVGRLTGVDHEEYVLGPEVTWVFETGPLGRYFGEGIADYCELAKAEHRVRRGGTVFIVRWPLGRMPTQRERESS